MVPEASFQKGNKVDCGRQAFTEAAGSASLSKEAVPYRLFHHGYEQMQINVAKYLLQRAKNLRWLVYTSICRPLGVGHAHSQAAWDKEYQQHVWDRLSQDQESQRYSIIAGFVQRLKPGGRILDAGCGEGLLLDHLPGSSYESYVGVDLSETAISRASLRQRDNIRFAAADISRLSLKETFDAIVVNEVLYYMERPIRVMRRLARTLADGGLFVVSMQEPSGEYIWPHLHQNFRLIDSRDYTNSRSVTWKIAVLQQ
jgi:SAM-dependent methyltransferase